MALSSSVEKVLRLVQERTGLPVHVEPDASLPANLFAKVTMARGAVPFHRVGYQPNASQAPDYLIVFQCGFILRRYAVPVEQRLDFAASAEAEKVVREWVRTNPKKPNISAQKVNGFVTILYDGLLNQLRSIPIGLRVDSWIWADFPDLADLQQQTMTRQLNDNAAALKAEVQGMIPDEALSANITMSAAYALYWAEKLERPQIALPYQATGSLEAGRALLNIWKAVPDNPANDAGLIDSWAERLGMKGWYRWVKQPNV